MLHREGKQEGERIVVQSRKLFAPGKRIRDKQSVGRSSRSSGSSSAARARESLNNTLGMEKSFPCVHTHTHTHPAARARNTKRDLRSRLSSTSRYLPSSAFRDAWPRSFFLSPTRGTRETGRIRARKPKYLARPGAMDFHTRRDNIRLYDGIEGVYTYIQSYDDDGDEDVRRAAGWDRS